MAAIDFDQHALCFRALGSGAPVVALHGSAATARQWASLSEHLGNDFRIIAPDMPGYGESHAWTPIGSASSNAGAGQDTTERVTALVQTIGRPVHLVGHSAGGVVALEIALERPDLVSSLTLIEPVVFHLLAGSDRVDRSSYREINCLAGVMGAALADGDPEIGMARFVDFWNGDGAWARMPAGRRVKLTGQAGQVVSDFASAFGRQWPISALKSLVAPVRLLMGLRSPAIAMRITELLAETIANAELSLVPEAGHMMPVTHPSLVGKIIERHVRQAEASHVRAWHARRDAPGSDRHEPIAA